jgi:NADP-dependent 3-hydroxy acid dehydrogenase YdfG
MAAAMTDFSGHTVLVTGAAAGIGFGIGAAFHAAGARVALGDVSTNGLGRAAERLGASDRVFTHAVEVRDASSVEKFFTASESAPWVP